MSKIQKIKKARQGYRVASPKDTSGVCKVKASILTTLLGELEGIAKKKEVDDLIIDQVITKFIKSNKETQLLTFDLEVARVLFIENEVLESFLPRQLSDAELSEAISKIIDTYHDTPNLVNMGVIMRELKAINGGQYDGKTASMLVKGFLNDL